VADGGRRSRGADRGGSARRPAPRSARRPSERARTGDPARGAAFDLLRAVADGAYANLELPRLVRQARLSGRDAAFATELAYGTIRMQGLYDAVIRAGSDRPLDRLDPPVLDVLRLGVHQLLGMRVPDHAAVSATVALTRERVGVGPAGFVNAVLRRVSELDRDAWTARLTEDVTEPVERLALVHSHPAWVVRALRAALLGHGASTTETVEQDLGRLLAAHNEPGELTLVARPGLAAEGELEHAGARPHPLVPTAWSLPAGDPGALAAVRDGRAAVQDAGSQLVALAALAAPVPEDRGEWLDLCAGPGGKAGLLAAAAAGTGARLRANELTPHRADLVRQTVAAAQAAGAAVQVTTADGRDIGRDEPGRYDRVLVDAPCTVLGALRRRPEARWRRSTADLAALGPLQRELLGSAVEATRPGGVVLYATCSPHLAETRFVVDDVLKRRTDAVLEDVRPLLTDRDGQPLPVRGDGPTAQLWPHLHDTDGMFLALLRRT
jgi:16S rRNA (cytosine967-C5)-methyltransferase